MTSSQPMAFYHEDGHVPAWNFAKRYAGEGGHVATLPDIIEARLATREGDLPWETYFATSSAEYYGIGRGGRPKLIVAHGVGPMSTIEGIKKAYAWEYKDKSRRKSGGRITSEEFLALEAGTYGGVSVIDLQDYLDAVDDPFYGFRTVHESLFDDLLMARLGPQATDYLTHHEAIAYRWLVSQSVQRAQPCIIRCEGPSYGEYVTYPDAKRRSVRPRVIPGLIEDNLAMGHVLAVSRLLNMRINDYSSLISDVTCMDWLSGARYVGVPAGASWQGGISQLSQPEEVLRLRWAELMRPNNDELYAPPPLYLLEFADGECFTRYSKQVDQSSMDEGDVEFHVSFAEPIGEVGYFTVDEMFFLRYRLSEVMAIAPDGANAYAIEDISRPDGYGITTVTVQFYNADVDTTHRLPRPEEIKQNYDLLMG